MKTLRFLRFAFGLALFTFTLRAQVPQLINYQGRVAVGTVNFEGAGSFKFALVNGTGTVTYWSNDGTSVAGSQPTAAVALTVTKGLYSVLLGDTALANMTALPASVFNNSDVRLRVWFNNGTHGSQLLTPDQRLAAVGYAMMAGTAQTVPDGAITGDKIADGAVGAAQLAAGAVGSIQIATGAVGSDQLAAGAVGATHLASGAVTNPALAAGVITGANLATQSRTGNLDYAEGFNFSGSTWEWSFTYNPPLNVAPVISQSPGGWALTPNADPITGFTASFDGYGSPAVVDPSVTAGDHPSLVMVDGNPAIAYYDATNKDLRFARNSAADGSGAWTITTVDSHSFRDVGEFPALAVLNGKPAISYLDGTNGSLKFARSIAADGSGAWVTTTVDHVNGFSVGTSSALAMVAGRPAISYLGENSFLKFARNDAPDGSGNWTISIAINNAGGGGYDQSLVVIGGNPAVSFYNSLLGNLRFARSSTPDGSGPWTVTDVDFDLNVGSYSSLAVAFGKPVISYYASTLGDLKFARNAAADGSGAWTITTVDSVGNVGKYTSLAIIADTPAISYYDVTNARMKFARNTMPDGSGNWVMGMVEDAAEWSSIISLGRGPAIAYRDAVSGNLHFKAVPPLNWTAYEFGTAGPIMAESFVGDGSGLTELDGAKISFASVTADQLAPESVTTEQLAANSVTTAQLAANSVTTAQLAANSVTTAQLAANSVTAAQLTANSVTTTQLADGSVTTAKLAAASVTGAQLASGAVTNTHLTSGIDAAKITAGILPDARLSANAALRSGGNAFTGNQILTSGKVGIGTATPARALTIQTAGSDYGFEHTNGAMRLSTYLSDESHVAYLGTVSNHSLGFFVNDGGAVLTIATNLGVGIGRSPTTNKLEVEGGASKTTAGSWLANSDRRIKEDIRPIGHALETLDRVRLVDFRYTEGYRAAHPGIPDTRYLNVVAQEFAEVFPEHVKGSGEKLPDGSEILQVDTYPLTIYSAAAVQELSAKLKAKDAEIAEMKQRLEKLEALVTKGAAR